MSPHLIAQNSSPGAPVCKISNNNGNTNRKQGTPSVAKQLFASTKSSKPTNAAVKSVTKPVSKSYASSSEFIDLDYQSGSSVTGSPTTANGSYQSLPQQNPISPLGRSKTLHLHELASYVSSRRYTQSGQYTLVADSDQGAENSNGDQNISDERSKSSSSNAPSSVPSSSSKSLTRRLSLWNNR